MPKVDRDLLSEAAAKGIVTPEQAERLWAFLSEHVDATPERGARFTFTNALYYLGGLLAVGAMGLFLKLAWDRAGGWGVVAVCAVYLVASLALATRLERRGLVLPVALLAMLATALVPLAGWGLEKALGIPVGPRPFALEVAALVAAVAALARFRTPVLVVPVAAALWYLGMDAALAILAPGLKPGTADDDLFRQWYSVGTGLAALAVAFRLDLRRDPSHDRAFWLHLSGLAAAWGGLTLMKATDLAGTLAYVAVNAALVLLGAAVARRAYTVAGAVGVALGLASLGDRYLRGSWLLPVAITLIGLGVVGFGLWWSRNESRLEARLQALLPGPVRASIAARRGRT